ncbi:MAG: aminopeptidase P family N-terminal domain-containing protein [Collinsella sp.]
MSEFAAGPAGRIERVRALMVERGYDAIVVRDEANLRWLTGVKGVFDYTFEFPHAAFITAGQCLFHTDSRYLNSFEENTPAGSPGSTTWTRAPSPVGSPARSRPTSAASALSRMTCRSTSTRVFSVVWRTVPSPACCR